MIIKGLDSLMAKLNALGGNVEKAIKRGVVATTEKARADAQGMTKGTVRGSIRAKYEKDGMVGVVYTNNPHAMYVEFGTGPVGAANHAGTSPNVGVSYTLRKSWVYNKDGKFYRTSGQPARPYMYPAAKMNEGTFQNETTKALLTELHKMGG
jgi:HK97 gp10 family phage protein